MKKMCPDRKVTQVHKAISIGNGDTTLEYFTECIGTQCVAYDFVNKTCKKYGTKVKEDGPRLNIDEMY